MTKPRKSLKKIYPHNDALIDEYNKTRNPELIVMSYQLNSTPPRCFRVEWENIAREMAGGQKPIKYNRKQGERALEFMSDDEVNEYNNAQKERNEKGATKYQSVAYLEKPAITAKIYRNLENYAHLSNENLKKQQIPRIKPSDLKTVGRFYLTAEQKEALDIFSDLIQLLEEVFKILNVPTPKKYSDYPPIEVIVSLLFLISGSYDERDYGNDEDNHFLNQHYLELKERISQKLDELRNSTVANS